MIISSREEWDALDRSGKLEAARLLYADHGGNASQASISIGLNRSTLHSWFKLINGVANESQIISSGRSPDKQHQKRILRNNGFDPDDWEVIGASLNEAEDKEGEISNQAWLKIKPRPSAALRPAMERTPGWTPPKQKTAKKQNTERYLLFTDPHCPLEETTLCDAAIALAIEIQPTKLICLGDATDNATFSRHRKNPRHDLDYSTQECVDSTYRLLARFADAAPNSERIILAGNHDWWLYHRVLETLPQLATLNVAESKERFLSFERLLRLDELGWALEHTRGGEYHDSTHNLLDNLVAMHGVRTGKMGGAHLEIGGWDGTSVAQGHDHKTALIRHVKRRPNNTEVAFWSWSLGAMSKRDLGYSHKRDVHQSFGVVTVWPDGTWQPELAVYDPQRDCVTYRDWRHDGTKTKENRN